MKITSSIIVALFAVSAFANPSTPAAHSAAPAQKEVTAPATTTPAPTTAEATPAKKAKKKAKAAASAATTEAPKH